MICDINVGQFLFQNSNPTLKMRGHSTDFECLKTLRTSTDCEFGFEVRHIPNYYKIKYSTTVLLCCKCNYATVTSWTPYILVPTLQSSSSENFDVPHTIGICLFRTVAPVIWNFLPSLFNPVLYIKAFYLLFILIHISKALPGHLNIVPEPKIITAHDTSLLE